MEEERAEQGVYEKLLFEAQMKEIDERREYARKLFFFFFSRFTPLGGSIGR